MYRAIIKYEWTGIWRNRWLPLAWIIFFLIGCYSLYQGHAGFVHRQKGNAAALQRSDSLILSVTKEFDTLTTTTGNRTDLEDPFYFDWRYQSLALKPVSPLGILHTGQSDVYTGLKSTRFGIPGFSNDTDEFRNPEKLLAGNLDMSFFIIFLLPLFFIALSYNLSAADRESGIVALLRSQASLRCLWFTRLLIRWIVAFSPAWVILGFSFLLLSNKSGFSVTAFLIWWGIMFLYAITWFLIASVITSSRLSSTVSAMVLTAVWTVLLVILPGLLNTWFNNRYPSGDKEEMAIYRDADYEAWEKQLSEHRAHLLRQYPKWEKEITAADSNTIKGFSYSLFMKENELSILESQRKQRWNRLHAEEQTYWVSPVAGLLRSLSSLGNTSLDQQLEFEQQVFQYREQKMRYLFENLLTRKRFSKDDFSGLPLLQLKPRKITAGKHLLPLLLLNLLLCVVLFLQGTRKMQLNA